MLLVSLSFTLMFKQAEASKDRAGGQARPCRCTELAGIAPLTALPRNVCQGKPSIRNLGWRSYLCFLSWCPAYRL